MNWLDVQLLIESMQKTMDCPICLEMMKNPVSTTCNHNFCNFCISKFIKSSRYVPCPLCKMPLSRRCFRENTKLQNIIDKVKKLVAAIETDTGWKYTTPTKHKALPKSGQKQQPSSTSVKRKISLADNVEDLDESEIRKSRFGKRKKSTDDEDKDSHCNDSLTSLDVSNLSKELNPEPCLGDRQETVNCVAPPVIQKTKSIAKDDSISKESKSKIQPPGNLRLTTVRSFDDSVRNNSDNMSILDNESQITEFYDCQTVPPETTNTNSLTPVPNTSAVSQNNENSRTEISDFEECSAVEVSHVENLSQDKENSRTEISDFEERPAAEVSRVENLTGRYNFRRSSICSTDGSVAQNEPSGSVQRLHVQKEVLKNIKNLTKASESLRKFDNRTVFESANQDLPENKRIMASPVKTRNRMKHQPSPEGCVAFGQGVIRHSTNVDNVGARNKLRKKEELIPEVNDSKSYTSRRTEMVSMNSKRNRMKCQPSPEGCVAFRQGVIRHSTNDDELRKKEGLIPDTSRGTLRTSIENVPVKVSTNSKRNESSSQSTFNDGSDCDNDCANGDNSKKTNSETASSCTFRKVEKDPFDRIANGPANKNGQSFLVWSSDSEDDQVIVKKSDKKHSFKWSVEPGKMKTYSRKHNSHKNRAKITKWLRLLPNNFDNTEDPTLNEDGELSLSLLEFSLQDPESGNIDSKRISKTDQRKEQMDCSIDSGPDISVSQLENNTSVLGNEDKTKHQKISSSVENNMSVLRNEDKTKHQKISSSMENKTSILGNEHKTKYHKTSSSVEMNNDCRPDGVHKKNEMNLSLNTLKEKNPDSSQIDVDIDLRITSDKKDLKSIEIQEQALRIPDHLTLGNISESDLSSEEKRNINRFAESEGPVDGNTLPGNLNPYEFVDSPKAVKQQKCHKRKNARKSLSKMPELSFENRLTRSYHKYLSGKNLAPNVLPSVEGIQEEFKDKNQTGKKQLTKVPGNHGTQNLAPNVLPSVEGIQEEFKDKNQTGKKQLTKVPGNHGTQIAQKNSSTRISQEKSTECLESSKKVSETTNAKKSFGSVPAQDNPASQGFLENSSKSTNPEGIRLDVCDSSKEQVASGDNSILDDQNTNYCRTSRTRKKSEGIPLDTCESSKELVASRDNSSLDSQNTDNSRDSKKGKQGSEKLPDFRFVDPLASGNNRKKAGQRRRSRRSSKGDEKMDAEREILELANQISSAEEHSFLFNSQDVCQSFDVSVDNLVVNDHDTSNVDCNVLCNRPGEHDNVTFSVMVNENATEDISTIQNKGNKIMVNGKSKNTNISDRNIDQNRPHNNVYGNGKFPATGTAENFSAHKSKSIQKALPRPQQNKDTTVSLSIESSKNSVYGNGKFLATGTAKNSESKPMQKTCSRPQQNNDTVARDNFLKPVQKSTLHSNKIGIDSLKKDSQVLALSLTEKDKLTDAKIIKSISSTENLFQRKNSKSDNHLVAPASLKEFQTKQLETKYGKDEFLKPAEKIVSRKSELGIRSSKNDPQISASTSSVASLEKNELVITKLTTASSKKNFGRKASLEAPPSLTRGTSVCQTVETVPSAAILTEPSTSSKIHTNNKQKRNIANLNINATKSESTNSKIEAQPSLTRDSSLCQTLEMVPSVSFLKAPSTDSKIGINKQRRNISNLNINSAKSESTNSKIETPVAVHGITVTDPGTPSLFDEQSRNSPKSDQRMSTPVTVPNVQKSVPQESKNAHVCNITIPITPITVIPESPFSEVPSTPGMNALGTPALHQAEQKNRVIRLSNRRSFIYKTPNLDKEALKNGKGIVPEISIPVEIVGSFQNSDSADLEKNGEGLRECDGEESKTDGSKSKHIAINSKLRYFSDVGDMNSTLCSSRTERGTLTDSPSHPPQFPNDKEDLSVKVWKRTDDNKKSVEEFGKGIARIPPSAAAEIETKPNLRYCGSNLSSLKDDVEPSSENCARMNAKPIKSSSQRWMDEDLLPLVEDSANHNQDQSQSAATSEESSMNPEMNGDWNLSTITLQPRSVKTGKEDLSLQDRDKSTQGLVTHEHVAHLPGNFHHLSDNYCHNDPSGIRMEKGSPKKNDISEMDEDSEGHSSGTEDLNVDPDPSEFEPPNLDIQPETVKKLLSDIGTTNLIKNRSPRYSGHATKLDKNARIHANLNDYNMESSLGTLEKSPVLTRSKTSVNANVSHPSTDSYHLKDSSKKKSSKISSKNIANLKPQNAAVSILESESILSIDRMVNSASTSSSSGHSSLKRNLEPQDEKLCESLNSPCQILCYSSDDTAKDSPKTKELSSMPAEPKVHISKASDNVEVLANVRLVDYEISQSSLLSETDSDSVASFTPLVGRRTRSSSRLLQNQSRNNAKTCKSELRKSSLRAKSANSNSLKNSRADSTDFGECNKVGIRDPDTEKVSLVDPDSLVTITDNLDSATILKSQGSSPSKINKTIPKQSFLPKSGATKKETDDLTITKSDLIKSSPKARLRNSDLSKNSNLAVHDECNKLDILDPDTEKESLTPTDSWITVMDNLDSATILKSPGSPQSKTNEAVAEELVLPKSGITEKETKNSTITESENFISSAERKFLRSGFCETEEFSEKVEEKDQSAVVNRKKKDDSNSELEGAAVSLKRKTEALSDCSSEDSDDVNSEKGRKSASRNITSFVVPPLVQNSENIIDEDCQSENTLEPTQMSLSNSLQSASQSDSILENQYIVTVSKKQSVPPPEIVKIDSLKVDIPDTEIEVLPPVASFSESVIPESLEPVLGEQQELRNEDVPKLLTANQNASQYSLSGFVPCSVEQDGTLVHVLEPFREVYTKNWKTVSENVCDDTNCQNNDIPENGGISERSKSLIMDDAAWKIPAPCQVRDESSLVDGMVHTPDNIQDNQPEGRGNIAEKSPLFSATTLSLSNTSKIAYSTECHLMIDSQNFFPVKRSKRKCFSFGASVPKSPQKPNEGDKTAVSCDLSAVTTNVANAECLDEKSATKVLQLSPVGTETSDQLSRNPPSPSKEAEKDVRNLSGTSSVQEMILKETNSFESCVLIPASEIGEFTQASTKDSCSVSHPKQTVPLLEDEQVEQPRSVPEEQKLDSVPKRMRSGNKSSSPKFVNSSGTKESVNNQQSLSSWISSANNNSSLRSSPRLRGRNKTVAKKQNEKKSLQRANQESVSAKLQRKIPFKTSQSPKVDPESLHLSPTDSDTQQPSCPLLSAEELEGENTVACDPADNDNNTAPTQAPSLDFSEPDRIMESPQRIPMEPTLEPDSDQPNPQEFLVNSENNSDCKESDEKDGPQEFLKNGDKKFDSKESDEKDDAKDPVELRKGEDVELQDDSQCTALSSASTKCPSRFSDSSLSAPSSQKVLSNLGDKDSSQNVKPKSKTSSGQKILSQNARMEISERKVESSNDETKTVTEAKELRIKERSVDDGFTSAVTNEPLTAELKTSRRQVKGDPLDDINFLPDIQSSFPQEFYPEIDTDKGQDNTLVQPEHPEEVSDITETSLTKKKSQDKHSECDSSEENSQEIADKERTMAKTQINNTDTKQADGERSFTVTEDVIVIDELPKGPDSDGMPRSRTKRKDPVIIIPAEARESTEQNVVSAKDPVDKNLSINKGKATTTAKQPSKDEDLESSEEFSLRRTKKPKYQVINDDSDDDDKKVEAVSVSASSPSALSTQSEKFSTQQCTHLEQDLEMMKKQIAQLEAQLGLNDSAVDLPGAEEEKSPVNEEDQKLPALDEQNLLPPDGDCKISREATKKISSDNKYARISSSSDEEEDEDDDDDMCRKVIPDSDPDEKNIEQNISTVFPFQKKKIPDVLSSGEESEDLFCTPGSSPVAPKLAALNLPRQKQSKKGADNEEEEAEEPLTDLPVNKNRGKRKRGSKDGTSKPSRLRIASSSSSEDDMEVLIAESPKPKVKAKENKKAKIAENKKVESPRNLEESLRVPTRNSPRSAKNHSKTIPKLKSTPQNKSSSPILKESSFTNTPEATTTSQPRQPKKTKCFIATGLSNIEVNEIKRLASLIGGEFLVKFSRDVTHVIVKTVSENVRYCDRTLKYFQGIANKSWILSYKWIRDSLEKNRLLKEDPYEIIGDSVNGYAHRGPTRSRLSHVPLFKNFEIHVVGESAELPQDDLRSLFDMAGGTVVADPEGFSSSNGITCLAIAGSNHSLREFRRLKNQLKIFDILLVSREWILDSVAMFRVQPLEGYIQLS